MILDCPDTQAEPVRNFLVRQAIRLQPQNLPLPRCKNAASIGNIRDPAHRVLLSTFPASRAGPDSPERRCVREFDLD
jgi:hypothetical protein